MPNKNRLFFIYFCIFIGFLAVGARLTFLVVLSDKKDLKKIYQTKGVEKRSNIVDRNGIIVATNLDIKVLYANSDLIRDPKDVAKKLTDAFPQLNYSRLLKRLSNKSRDGWIFVKRNVTPKEEKIINNLAIAGLIFENDKVRVYPQKASLSHVVGYTDLDGNGISGIEKQYDQLLKTKKENLQLTIDIRIQDILNHELKSAIKKYKASAAFGIIMDVTNGEIIALSSLPNFDLNNQSTAGKKEKFNRATYGVYELGSVFKVFNHAHALDKKLVRLKGSYSVKDPIKYGKFKIDDDHKDKNTLTVQEIFTHSSNIGSVKIAQNFSPKEQKKFLAKLGLLKKLDMDYPSLGKPILPRKWGEISRATISFGHGIAVSPLHLIKAFSGVVNDGKLVNPAFVKSDLEIESKQVIKKETSNIIKKLLRKTVLEGTGKNAKVEGYQVGGKTGTAEKAERGGYNKRKTLASFVATFPTNEPKYALFIGIDSPNSTFNTGGMVAAPVAGKVIKNIAPILGGFYE